MKLEARDQWFLKSMETITNIHPFPIAITDIQSLSQSGLFFFGFSLDVDADVGNIPHFDVSVPAWDYNEIVGF